jgi:hypothetical protein
MINETDYDNSKQNDKIEGLSNKFTQNDWSNIERRYTPFELKVLECLKLLATSDTFEIKQEYNVLGEKLYISNRTLLENANLVIKKTVDDVNSNDKLEIKKGKGKGKEKKIVISKKDEIILENSIKRAKEHIEKILKTFDGEFQPKYAFTSDIVEIKGLGLLYAGNYLLNNNKNFRKKKHLTFVFTVMISIDRFINNCKDLEGKNFINSREKVAESLISDLNCILKKLRENYTYNGLVIHDYAPELLVHTDYDNAIPRIGIKPRKHQINLMNFVKLNFDSGFLACYNPPMGSGKTTAVVSMAHYIEWIRNNTDNKKIQLIFACNLVPVRDHAASLCYNAGIKFGIGYRSYFTKKCKIQNHYGCARDDERIVIITSPELAYELLDDDPDQSNYEKYVLFLDEPTVGADCEGSETLKTNMAVLTVSPKRLILSSATFPEMNLLPEIRDYFIKKYPGIAMETIYSREIQIGCDIKTFNFDLVVPHLGIKNRGQLIETISTIDKNPFLGRTYTSDVVRSLWKNMHDHNIKNIPNIKEEFENIDNMTCDRVREIAMDMLHIISECDNTIIEKICSSKILKDTIELENIEIEKNKICKNIKSSNNIFESDSESEEIEEDPSINYKKLLTTQGWIMQNTTLIATLDPMKFVEENFYNFVEEIYKYEEEYINPITKKIEKKIYKNTKNILKQYEKELNDMNKQKEEYEKSIEKKDKKDKKDRDSEKLTKNAIDQKIQGFEDKLPKINFPDYGHVNCLPHLKKYSKNNFKKILGKNIRTQPPIENINYKDFDVPDEILTLLFAGVGIYSTINKSLCPKYLKTVLEMASSGQLAYIVSDISICYGTNYPINRVIVTDEFAKNHSINTLFQLFGRAGRVGRSWIAVVYISNHVAKQIIDYTQLNIKVIVEIDNMTKVFNGYVGTTFKTKNDFLELLFNKYDIDNSSEDKKEVKNKYNANECIKTETLTFNVNANSNLNRIVDDKFGKTQNNNNNLKKINPNEKLSWINIIDKNKDKPMEREPKIIPQPLNTKYQQFNNQENNYQRNNQQFNNQENNYQRNNQQENNQQGNNYQRNNQQLNNQQGNNYQRNNQQLNNYQRNNQQGNNYQRNNQQGNNYQRNNQQGNNYQRNNHEINNQLGNNNIKRNKNNNEEEKKEEKKNWRGW